MILAALAGSRPAGSAEPASSQTLTEVCLRGIEAWRHATAPGGQIDEFRYAVSQVLEACPGADAKDPRLDYPDSVALNTFIAHARRCADELARIQQLADDPAALEAEVPGFACAQARSEAELALEKAHGRGTDASPCAADEAQWAAIKARKSRPEMAAFLRTGACPAVLATAAHDLQAYDAACARDLDAVVALRADENGLRRLMDQLDCPDARRLARQAIDAREQICATAATSWLSVKARKDLGEMKAFLDATTCPTVAAVVREDLKSFEETCERQNAAVKAQGSDEAGLRELLGELDCPDARRAAQQALDASAQECATAAADWSTVKARRDPDEMAAFITRTQCRAVVNSARQDLQVLKEACQAQLASVETHIADDEALRNLMSDLDCPAAERRAQQTLEAHARACTSAATDWSAVKARKNRAEMQSFIRETRCPAIAEAAQRDFDSVEAACRAQMASIEAHRDDEQALRDLAGKLDCPEALERARQALAAHAQACGDAASDWAAVKARKQMAEMTAFIEKTPCRAVAEQARTELQAIQDSCARQQAEVRAQSDQETGLRDLLGRLDCPQAIEAAQQALAADAQRCTSAAADWETIKARANAAEMAAFAKGTACAAVATTAAKAVRDIEDACARDLAAVRTNGADETGLRTLLPKLGCAQATDAAKASIARLEAYRLVPPASHGLEPVASEVALSPFCSEAVTTFERIEAAGSIGDLEKFLARFDACTRKPQPSAKLLPARAWMLGCESELATLKSSPKGDSGTPSCGPVKRELARLADVQAAREQCDQDHQVLEAARQVPNRAALIELRRVTRCDGLVSEIEETFADWKAHCDNERVKLASIVTPQSLLDLRRLASRPDCEDIRPTVEQTVCQVEDAIADKLKAQATRAELEPYRQNMTCEHARATIEAALEERPLPPPAPPPTPIVPPRPPIQAVQRQLQRLGCYSGPPSGLDDAVTQEALRRYFLLAAEPAQPVDDPLVARMQTRTTRLCPCPMNQHAEGLACIADPVLAAAAPPPAPKQPAASLKPAPPTTERKPPTPSLKPAPPATERKPPALGFKPAPPAVPKPATFRAIIAPRPAVTGPSPPRHTYVPRPQEEESAPAHTPERHHRARKVPAEPAETSAPKHAPAASPPAAIPASGGDLNLRGF